MTRISLVNQAIGRKLKTPIQDLNLVGAVASDANPTSDFEFEVCCGLLFIMVEIFVGAQRREVISMDNDAGTSHLVHKATLRCGAGRKAQRLQGVPET